MAVTSDAVGTRQQFVAGTSANYTNITVGTGSNRGLDIKLFFGAAVTGVSCTWDSGGTNQAMTSVASAANGRLYIFAVANPTSGNKTLAISWTTSTTLNAVATSWNGVDQTGGTTSFPNGTTSTGSTNTSSVTVTSATGDIATAGHTTSGGNTFSAVSGTAILATGLVFEANYDTGAATVTLTGTATGAAAWVAVGVDIKASGAAADTFADNQQIFMM